MLFVCIVTELKTALRTVPPSLYRGIFAKVVTMGEKQFLARVIESPPKKYMGNHAFVRGNLATQILKKL